MSKGKITPNNILHFNKKSKVEEDRDCDGITLDNILERASSDNVSDALKNLYGKSGLLKYVKPLSNDFKVAGFIRTAETNSNDWGTGVKAIYSCDEDEILLIKCSNNDYAIWGGLASLAALTHGLKATVIIGSSRDSEDILELGYPVFSQEIQSRAGFPLNNGSIGEKLVSDDLVIETGDFAICDMDGVVIIPKDKIDEVLLELNRIKKFEEDCVKKIRDENIRMDVLVGL